MFLSKKIVLIFMICILHVNVSKSMYKDQDEVCDQECRVACLTCMGMCTSGCAYLAYTFGPDVWVPAIFGGEALISFYAAYRLSNKADSSKKLINMPMRYVQAPGGPPVHHMQ